MNKEKVTRLRSRAVLEKNSKNTILEFLHQSKLAPAIEFKIEQQASNYLCNYLLNHNLMGSFEKWKEKQHLI